MAAGRWKIFLALGGLLGGQIAFGQATGNATGQYVDPLASPSEQAQCLADLKSRDPIRLAAAVKKVHDCATIQGHARTEDLRFFIQAGKYDELERAAIDGTLINSAANLDVAGYEKMRMLAFSAAGKRDKLLAAARAYFNVANLSQSTEAMNAITGALVQTDREQEAAEFWKRQMHSLREPATQPTTRETSALESAQINEPRLQQAIARIRLTSYTRYLQKGNLLLATGRADEARQVYLEAIKAVPARQLPHAIENIARAIRAQAGLEGAANAFLARLQEPAGGAALGGRFDDATVAAAAAQVTPAGRPNIKEALALAERDVDLRNWLSDWAKSATAERQLTKASMDQLAAILEKTRLSCSSLMEIGRQIAPYCPPQVVADFDVAGVHAGDRALAQDLPGTDEARRTVFQMRSAVGFLWYFVDSPGESKYTKALQTINRDALYWISPDDIEAVNARRWSMIGEVEILHVTGHVQEALAKADAIDQKGMSESQKVKIAWVRALCLLKLKRPAEAIAPLKFVADSSIAEGESARPVLEQTLRKLGRKSEADAMHRRYSGNADSATTAPADSH